MITTPNGTVLSKISGDNFTANKLLGTFCILGTCPTEMMVIVTMADSGSNGWESNVIAFRQNNTFVGTFGDAFISGSSSGPLSFYLILNIPTQITVIKLGNNTN